MKTLAEKLQFKVSFDLAQLSGTNNLGKQNLVKKILSKNTIACFSERIDIRNIPVEGQNPIKQHLYIFKCANAQAFEKVMKEHILVTVKIKNEDGKLDEKILKVKFNKVEKKEIIEEEQRNIVI
jgi:hypothetical protein